MGPGGVGTGTPLGFGALEQGAVLDTAAWLGGTPIACVRYADRDARERHRGVSHHTLTVLGRATQTSVLVPVPQGMPAVTDALTAAGIDQRHQSVTVAIPDVDAVLARAGIGVTTMGRGPDREPGFFAVAAAAGVGAASIGGGTGYGAVVTAPEEVYAPGPPEDDDLGIAAALRAQPEAALHGPVGRRVGGRGGRCARRWRWSSARSSWPPSTSRRSRWSPRSRRATGSW